jgi:hypothetical protein
MTEAFGTYSVAVRLVRASDAQPVKTGYAERPLRSMDDLSAVSGELARQLLPPGSDVPPAPALAAAAIPPPPPAAAAPAAPKQCDKNYNINEVLFKVKSGFPGSLKDCSSKLAKEMMLAASPFGKKGAAPEPKSFMTQCAVDGVKKSLPDGFPNADKLVGSVNDFVQGILNSAMAGASLDPRKLISAVGSMSVEGLLGDIRKLASDECVVDEPYTPPAAQAGGDDGDGEEEEEEEKSSVSFGIRAGMNFSHTYAEYSYYDRQYSRYRSGDGAYDDILGFQAGFVVDFALTSWFHLQPGLMYMQKGMEDRNDVTAHYLELPFLLSLKLAALRLNAGPYFGLCLESGYGLLGGYDIGLSTGVGFDIGMFYIGAFHGYGFKDVSKKRGYDFYNRTLGFNIGVNL